MVNRLKNALWLIVGAVVAVWALTSLVGLVRAGDMDPPGPPGGTMKTLFAIEPRTVIWQPGAGDFPIVISQPGSYYLGENINGEAAKDGIHIRADNVTLDLNGFTLKGADGKSSYNGITVPYPSPGAVYNLSIFNGTIRDWGNAGIAASSPNGDALNSQLRDLKVYGNGAAGVRVEEALVTGVISKENGAYGISVKSGQISDSESVENVGDGIYLEVGIVRGCNVQGNRGDGIQVVAETLIVDNTITRNGVLAGGHGINMINHSHRIEGNSIIENGSILTLTGDGIHAGAAAAYNHIEGNELLGNVGAGINTSLSGRSVIVKNTGSGNGGGNYVTAGTDTVGQILNCAGGCPGIPDTAGLDEAWANFSH